MAAILLVVGDAAVPTAADTVAQGFLEDLGHTVTLRSDETAEGTPSGTGFDGVVISESVSSTTIAGKYREAAMPVCTHEDGNPDNLGIGTGTGSVSNHDQLVILNDTHPVANGSFGSFTGTVTVLSSAAGGVVFSRVTGASVDAVAVAHTEDSSANLTFCAYDAGDARTDTGTCPDKRLTIPFRQPAMTILTADGENLLKNAYAWMFGAAGSNLTHQVDDTATVTDTVTPDTGAQTLRPDADLATTGWAIAPLHSKISDESDATVITATCS
jgi:hypothetical protein